jgi:hypothetical protein
LANLSINKLNECKNDIKFLISTIKKESSVDKQILYLRIVIYTLFKVESLINFDINDDILNTDKEMNESIKIVNHIMKGFMHFLQEKNFSILLNVFKEAAQKFKKLNDLNGYYFSLFFHYLVLYNQKKNSSNQGDIESIKKNISICNNNLIGNEFANQVKEKDVNILLNEFINKINCACEIFKTLTDFENELNLKLNEIKKERRYMNLSEDEKNMSNSQILDKSHIFTNDKINSSIFVILLLKYSIKFLEEKKKNNPNDNYNTLINEVKIMLKKIEKNEINLDNLRLQLLDKDMINSLKQLFDNLIYIYYKCRIYRYFRKYRNKIRKMKNNKNMEKILSFLSANAQELINGLELNKINFKSKGYKTHVYDVDENEFLFNVRPSKKSNPSKSYSIQNDIVKITYGLKSKNLIKKLSSNNDNDKKLIKRPWNLLSVILRDRSIDLSCEGNKLNYMFYGMKYFLVDNNVPFKINSVNYFVLNKLKLKICIILKKQYKGINEEEIPNIIKQLTKEKAIQNISFAKIFLLFNKYSNV